MKCDPEECHEVGKCTTRKTIDEMKEILKRDEIFKDLPKFRGN